MTKKWSRIAGVLIALIGVAPLATATPDETRPEPLNWEDLKVGDLVAVGRPNRASTMTDQFACEYDTFGIRTPMPFEGGLVRSLGLENTEACNLRVVEKTESAMVGPSDDVMALLADAQMVPDLMVDTRDGVRFSSSMDDICDGAVSVENVVHSYGWGGKWDKLTKNWGRTSFRIGCDSGEAHIAHRSGQCWAKFDGWETEQCFYWDMDDNAFEVQNTGRGDFHWNCGSGTCYNHELYDQELARNNGSAWCDHWVTGTVVNGVTSKCSLSNDT